jgi:predicted PurR-regulated permease PerM
LPHFREQRQAVIVVREIENSITTYLATITLINIVLGGVVGLLMYLLGMPNPVLWGVLAGVLNYIPYVGPAATTAILALVALLTFPELSDALLPPGLFLLITTLEGYVVTPAAVGNRLTLNPLVIFLTLIVWFWMWGVVGALLTVPLLVCAKAVLERSHSGTALARILD